MTAFKRKKLKKVKRVCLRLREARTAAGFSIEKIVEKTHIEKKHILALERCEFEKLPAGEIYRKQIIKKYLRAIGTDTETYLTQYMHEEAASVPKNTYHPHRIISKKYFQNIPSLVRFITITAGAILLVSYLGVQINRIVRPPQLVLLSPSNGYITNELSLEVIGQTGKDVSISINGTGVTHTGTGLFSQKIDLVPGINTITITAQRKHGKTTTEVRHVILKEDRAVVGFSDSKAVRL